MAANVFKLEEMTSKVFGDFPRDKTVIFLPVSPLEGHGPHLPVGLDYFNAIYFAEQAAMQTAASHPHFNMVICPALPFGSQLYKQPGSLRTDSANIYYIVRDIGASLATWGFKYIFIVCGHGSPRDIVALEAACKKVSRKHRIQMHNLSGALAVRFLKGEFIDEISEGLSRPLDDSEKKLLKIDVHGGWWETSMMLMHKPELVDPLYKSLPDITKYDDQKPQYVGAPRFASAEFAEVSMRSLSRESAKLIGLCIAGEDISEKTTSPLYKILTLRPLFKRKLFGLLLLIVKLIVIIWLIHRAFSR